MRKSLGFTLVELLVVMGILAIVSVPAFYSLKNLRANQAITASTDKLRNILVQAHIFSREAKDNKAWGVVSVDSNTYRIVSRIDATSPVSSVSEYSLEPPTLFVGTFSIWFLKGSGDLADLQTITVQSSPTKTSSIEVNKNGNINVN